MRADLQALHRAQQIVSIPEGPGCKWCGRADIAKGDDLCGRCRREWKPSALDVVLGVLGMSPRAFAEATGLPVRTVIRACKGLRLGKRNAAKFAKVTGLPVEVFRRGNEAQAV